MAVLRRYHWRKSFSGLRHGAMQSLSYNCLTRLYLFPAPQITVSLEEKQLDKSSIPAVAQAHATSSEIFPELELCVGGTNVRCRKCWNTIASSGFVEWVAKQSQWHCRQAPGRSFGELLHSGPPGGTTEKLVHHCDSLLIHCT